MNHVSAASFMIGVIIMGRSLSEMFPELAEEWSDRNLPLRPDQITYGSNKRVWWHGKCGHEWETSVKARTSGERCPYCSGKRVLIGFNDLQTIAPGLAADFYNGKKSTYRKTDEYNDGMEL